jgi:hypothetical protein
MCPDTYILERNLTPHASANGLRPSENRVLRRDDITDDFWVSTVFLGCDHNVLNRRPPVIWETMIVGGPSGQGDKAAR